jgi:hypothetical protein
MGDHKGRPYSPTTRAQRHTFKQSASRYRDGSRMADLRSHTRGRRDFIASILTACSNSAMDFADG